MRWNSGVDFLYQDSNDPICDVSNVGAEGKADIAAIIQTVIASDKTFYAMRFFQRLCQSQILSLPVVLPRRKQTYSQTFDERSANGGQLSMLPASCKLSIVLGECL